MLRLARVAPRRAARVRRFRVHRAEPGFLAATAAFGPRAEATTPLTYYSAWFCPFAHRATLALEHHADVVPYAWEEALGWEQRPPTGDEDLDADDREDFWYHYKSPGLMEANPLGMVPTLVDENGRVVTESAVCVQFVDELARVRGGAAPPLVDADPFVAARSRCAADKVNRTVCSGYYRVLVRTEDEERKEGFAQILDGLSAFFDDDDASDLNGPFWGGRASPGLPDLVLFPYAYRLYVLEHYRGPDFAIPSNLERYWRWYDAVVALDAVARTLPDKDRYLSHVAKYAHNKARSKVGNAVRRGAAAHDYDDEKDGDK